MTDQCVPRKNVDFCSCGCGWVLLELKQDSKPLTLRLDPAFARECALDVLRLLDQIERLPIPLAAAQ